MVSMWRRLAAGVWVTCAVMALAISHANAADQPGEVQAIAQDQALAGHSAHGEAFNEGPRQRAYLMPGTGRVRFDVTAADERAKDFVRQGVGQLHGFWYFEAERSFRQAAAIDADCAIAYWGMAMANVNNEKRAKSFIDEAARRKGKASERERLYIEALHAYYHAAKEKQKTRGHDYAKALERLIYKYPDDLDAKAWLALQLWKNASAAEPIRSHLAVDALLGEVFAAEPMHPAHHYRIHLWDKEKAEKALESAARCGQAAPGIAHMWHMPGHIYSKLRRYADAAWQQEASARVDHAHMMRDRVMPDQIHNFAHNNEWLIRNLNFLGRAHDAVDLARNMIELPRHPAYNTPAKRGSASLGRQRLFETLDRWEMDEQLAALAAADSPYLEPTDMPAEQARRLVFLGRAAFRQADADALAAHRAELEKLLKADEKESKGKAESKAKAAEDEKNDGGSDKENADDAPAAGEEPKPAASKPSGSASQTTQRYLDELNAYAAALEGGFDKALAELKKIKSLEAMHLARVQQMAGRHDDAEKTLRDYIKRNAGEVQPLAQLVAVLWDAGKKDDARKVFDELRSVAAHADLDVKPLVHLAPIATELGYGNDWRASATIAADVGERPKLDELGPFRWAPSAAPAWSLSDADGGRHSLADCRGRPVVVIFYLGQGCLHCTQQLQAFAPRKEAFEQAGIAMIAIGTDTREKLREAVNTYGEAFAIPLVSDAKLDVFKSYRAFDDFEGQPLHGTFLIDGEGRVRWQDISYEPFMEAEFLLGEAKRLLGQDEVKVADPRK